MEIKENESYVMEAIKQDCQKMYYTIHKNIKILLKRAFLAALWFNTFFPKDPS
jgi:hypothetical protein